VICSRNKSLLTRQDSNLRSTRRETVAINQYARAAELANWNNPPHFPSSNHCRGFSHRNDRRPCAARLRPWKTRSIALCMQRQHVCLRFEVHSPKHNACSIARAQKAISKETRASRSASLSCLRNRVQVRTVAVQHLQLHQPTQMP
jgi:hypothetical protein